MKIKKAASMIAAIGLSTIFTVPAFSSSIAVTKTGSFPVVEKPVTINVFTQCSGSTVENIQTNEFTKWYEEKTNVKFNWEVVTTGASDKITLKVASMDLPDVFLGGNINDSSLLTWALRDKIFCQLDDAVKNYGPNITKMLNDNASARDYAWMPDGHMYSLLRVVDTYNERVTKRAWVYEPWLKKLNIKMPTTTDEFYNMLVAFKTKDPNGNGKADEIPLAGALLTNPANNEPESFLMNSFCFYEGTTFLEVDKDGKTIKCIAATPEYREGLKYLAKLYKENLLAHETFTQDRKGLLAATEGGEVNTLGVATAMYWGHFTTEGGKLGRDKEFVAVPVLKGPKGVQNAYDRGVLVNNGKLVVTIKAKDKVDTIVRWADWFFDPDAMMTAGYSANYGPEGKGWAKAEAGLKNADGQQAKYKYLRFADLKQNDNWFQTEPYYESRAFLNSFADDAMNRKESFGGKETAEKYMPYSAYSKKVPFMYLPLDNLDEAVSLKDTFTNTTTGMFNVYRTKFITGELNVNDDKVWNNYVNDLNKNKVSQYVALYQSMLADYNVLQEYVKTKK